jgi:LacI family transcriptional regulator
MLNERRIGVVIPAATGYLCDVVRGVAAVVRPHRTWTLRVAGGINDWIPRMLEWKPDGVIANVFNQEIAARLRDLGVPVVNFAAGIQPPDFASVYVDGLQVGAMAAEHLLSMNLRSFAFWAGANSEYVLRPGRGFFAALRDHGVPEDRMHTLSPPAYEDWRQRDQAIREWLAALPTPIGLLAGDDAKAYYLSDLTREMGLDIPNEISLIGVGDDPLMCKLTDPPLSSVRIPGRQVGIRAAKVLAIMLEGGRGPVEPIRYGPIGVIERGSTDMLAIDNACIAAAVKHIRNHATEGVTVADVLQRIPMARRTFETQFRNLFGRSPGEEIRRVRLARAQMMLIESDASITEVARKSGFCDGEYFGRVYKKTFGLTPSQYRRQCLG